MILFDIEQLALFNRVGHRFTGDPRKGSSPGVGCEKVHVAVDDATRPSYAGVLPDEKGLTTMRFLSRAVAWFNCQGIKCLRLLRETARPTCPMAGEKPGRPWDSRRRRTGPTTLGPTARLSGSS